MSAAAEVSSRLVDATQDAALESLGLREDDRADVQRAVAAALEDDDRLADVAALTERLRESIGVIGGSGPQPFDTPIAKSDWHGIGVLPVLALLATADDVRAFHRSRGIPEAVSERTLADIGQQIWVHRRTYGAFGLDTYDWETLPWSGNLYWLGRLQYELVQHDGGWVLSTHIPETGPLTPAAVDESFAQATDFFAEHFSDRPADRFHCSSWLLDPQLAEVLDPESNMVRFQQRWTLEGEGTVADADAIYFVFRKRGEVDRATLPRDTTLQRAILDRLDAGGHWNSWNGTIDQSRWR
ncbi:acyltransferase domain-containing protein [Amnibacterium sp. CER49]|uniref:acyltransferase domain-containing protein n=1 Tax=Amnibacterium sp. CER49 TaxID=3039161 RepID=UPI00244C9CDC|nr:acyltransferase domain-containing protein [Amnibacterium sp. CER49]MDH2444084.1 acyltransferase domain-containing protein [Amnibacterium sp. CER49]